jgi:hypothetical protein
MQNDTHTSEQEQSGIIDSIGITMRTLFEQAEKDRRPYEDEWLKDLRQYKGQYEPEVEKNIKNNRSKAFIRLTRTKVRTMDARAGDLLFPSGGDKNWSISPTPEPDIPVEKKIEIGSILAQESKDGMAPEEEEVEDAIKEFAKETCKRMESTMDDQLMEADYEEKCRKVIHQGHVLGTGILKGPLVETRARKSWQDTGNGYQINEVEERKPYYERCDLWNYYPVDLMVNDLRESDSFERHIMTKAELRKLARRPDFDSKKILAYITGHKSGDIQIKYHEQELKNINGSLDAVYDRRNKYEVLEYWGYMDGQDLQDCGCEINDDELHLEFEANVWVLGTYVIKAVLNPTAQKEKPYNFYLFESDDTGPFGVSIPSILRDTQTLFNAAIRITIDNAAITAGPVGEVNINALHESEDPTDIYPFKMFLRDDVGVDASIPALRFHKIESHTAEMIRLAHVFKELGDEASTIPSYMHGESDKGVGRTVGGLSMLMGAANITVKDVVKNFDDGITEPTIEALYHWNMQFNPKENIKGDFKVKARGSSSLVAKEIQAKQLSEFHNSLESEDAPYVDRGELRRHMARAMDMPEGVVRSKEDADEVMFLRNTIDELTAALQQMQEQMNAVTA